MNEGLDEYIADNYGRCKLTQCKCRDPVKPRFSGEWVGRLCPDWQQLNPEEFSKIRNFLMIKDK